MKYLLLLTNDADQIAEWERLSDDEKKRLRDAEVPKWNELFGQMQAKGQWVDGLELDEPKEAKSVQARTRRRRSRSAASSWSTAATSTRRSSSLPASRS